MSAVLSLFDAPFDKLTRDDVARFLEQAGDEGLTWEAKGDLKTHAWVRPEQVYIPMCGFANSHLPGVLLIGASQDKRSGVWQFDGLAPPGETTETTAWLNRVIRSGLNPVPRYTISDIWSMGNGRVAAAVLAEPVEEPPCLTRDGRVFQRTSSETVTVKDPLELARLYSLGDQARQNAEAVAIAAAGNAYGRTRTSYLERGLEWPEAAGAISLSIAAAHYDEDIGGKLFRRGFGDLVSEVCTPRLRAHDVPQGDQSTLVWPGHQDYVVASVPPSFTDALSRWWGVVCDWTGGVAVTCGVQGSTASHRLANEILPPAWEVAAALVKALGGSGRVHAVLEAWIFELNSRRPPVSATIRRWHDDPDAGREAAVGIMVNELRRANREPAWADEPA